MKSEPGVSVALVCIDCGKQMRCEVNAVWLNPAPERVDPEWDGVFLQRIVTCEACGAVDRYRLEPEEVTSLRARANASGPIRLGRVESLDGHPRRPIEAIDWIRNELAQRPSDGALWRRLGNAWNFLGNLDEAARAWKTAVEADNGEFPAALSLALLSGHGTDADEATATLMRALARVSGLQAIASDSPSLVAELVDLLIDLLANFACDVPETTLMIAWAPPGANRSHAKNVVVTMSGIDLRSFDSWDRLAEFFAYGFAITAALHFRSPDEVSQLQQFLESDRDFAELLWVPRLPERRVWVSPSKKRKKAAARA